MLLAQSIAKTSVIFVFSIISTQLYASSDINEPLDTSNYIEPGTLYKLFEENDKECSEPIMTRNEYSDVGCVVNGFAKVSIQKENKRLYGFIDTKGNEVITPQYDSVRDFEMSHIAEVQIEGKSGYVNQYGKVIVPIIYDEVRTTIPLIAARINGDTASEFKETLYSIQGDIVIQTAENREYLLDTASNHGLSFYQIDKTDPKGLEGGFGFINYDGDIIAPAIYDYKIDFIKNIARVGYQDKYGFINPEGKIIIPIEYDTAANSCNSLCDFGKEIATDEGSESYFDKEYIMGALSIDTGEVVFPLEYQNVAPFNKWLTLLYKDDHVKFGNRYGDYISDEVFEQITPHPLYNIVVYKKEGKYGFMDLRANKLTDNKYDYIYPLVGNDSRPTKHFTVIDNDKVGMLDHELNVVIPFEYDNPDLPVDTSGYLLDGTYQFVGLYTVAYKDGKYGVINVNNDVVLPFEYDSIDMVVYFDENDYIHVEGFEVVLDETSFYIENKDTLCVE